MDDVFKPVAQVAADEHTASFCNNIHRGFSFHLSFFLVSFLLKYSWFFSFQCPRQSPSSPLRQQYVIVPCPTPDADPEDFSHRLKISSSPSPRPSESTTMARKLFNPDTDPMKWNEHLTQNLHQYLQALNNLPILLLLHHQLIIETTEVTLLVIYSIIERTIQFIFP